MPSPIASDGPEPFNEKETIDTAAAEEEYRQAERKVVRKVDLLLMPLLTCAQGLAFFDKQVLNSASIFGIIKDLKLSTTSPSGVVSTLRYSTANSAFYWGYIVAVLPLSVIIQRFPLAKAVALLTFIWGVVVILTVVVQDHKGLIVQRVALGVAEAPLAPAFVIITGMWYKKSEQATRLGIWYSSTGIFSMFNGVVNYGLGRANSSLAPWKLMYLFAGALTIVWSAVIFYFLPDSPATSHRWFNEAERAILARRTRESMIGAVGPTKFKMSHAREAALDIKLYLYFLMGTAIYVTNGGVTAFGARIVSSFGYSSLTTILLLIPGGAATVLAIFFFTWLNRWKNITTLLIPLSCLPVVVGSLIIWLAPWTRRGVPLFGYYCIPTFGAPYVLVLANSAVNVSGSTKKAITAGVIFVGYNVGNIIGPYLVFTPERAIKYRSTWIAIIICMGITSALSLLLRFILVRDNTRRDSQFGAEGGESKEALNSVEQRQEELDLTDGQNKAFRYSL